MDAKQEARAIELRAFAEKVVKERGTCIDTSIPNRMVLLFDDRDLQIVYREPLEINDNNPKLNDFARKVGTPVIEHYAVDIFLVPPGRKLTETKVLTVFWKEALTSIEVETYVQGSWEKRLEALAADMKMRVVQ